MIIRHGSPYAFGVCPEWNVTAHGIGQSVARPLRGYARTTLPSPHQIKDFAPVITPASLKLSGRKASQRDFDGLRRVEQGEGQYRKTWKHTPGFAISRPCNATKP
jgi:hypothetical protein